MFHVGAYTITGHVAVFEVCRWILKKHPHRSPLIATIRQSGRYDSEERWSEERFKLFLRNDTVSGEQNVEITPLN